MIISDLNVLQTVETGNVLGGYSKWGKVPTHKTPDSPKTPYSYGGSAVPGIDLKLVDAEAKATSASNQEVFNFGFGHVYNDSRQSAYNKAEAINEIG